MEEGGQGQSEGRSGKEAGRNMVGSGKQLRCVVCREAGSQKERSSEWTVRSLLGSIRSVDFFPIKVIGCLILLR